MPPSMAMFLEQARSNHRDQSLSRRGGTPTRKATRTGEQETPCRRKTIVEPVFGWIRENLGFRRWTVRGPENARTQWSLLITTINLKKLYRYWVEGHLRLAPC
jgi:hypothetical protein